MAYCGNKVCSLYTHTYIYHILMVFFSTTPMSQLAPLYPSYHCLNASLPMMPPHTIGVPLLAHSEYSVCSQQIYSSCGFMVYIGKIFPLSLRLQCPLVKFFCLLLSYINPTARSVIVFAPLACGLHIQSTFHCYILYTGITRSDTCQDLLFYIFGVFSLILYVIIFP